MFRISRNVTWSVTLMLICYAKIKCCWINNIMAPASRLHSCLKSIFESLLFSFPPSINNGINKNYRGYFNNLSRKVDSEWCYWNGIICSWSNLLFMKIVTPKTKWTLQDFNKVNIKVLKKIKIPRKIRINKSSSKGKVESKI